MISRIALALALVATAGTTTLHADTFDRVAPRVVTSGAEGGATVRVFNNYGRHVRVYVVDSDNRRHLLGSVGNSRVKDLQIPKGLVRGTGTVQLKVYPIMLSPGIGVSAFELRGIKTRELSVQSDQVIELYVATNHTAMALAAASGGHALSPVIVTARAISTWK